MPHHRAAHARLAQALSTASRPLTAILAGLGAGALIITLSGYSPLQALAELLRAGFSCSSPNSCALFTTLQYAIPLMLLGLSAALSLRAGIFSLGQYGSMLLGAAMSATVAGWWPHPAPALAGAMLIGALWALLPVMLKLALGVNEIISSILFNTLASFCLGWFAMGRIVPEARLLALAPGTKLSVGIFFALAAGTITWFYLFRSTWGYAARVAGAAPAFARNGGVRSWRAISGATLLAGAWAGLAGGIEVLGVHYHFVSTYTENIFDGVIVALLGQLHPLGILPAGLFLGGLRLGSLTGLLLGAGVPREIGSIMVAVMIIALGVRHFRRENH